MKCKNMNKKYYIKINGNKVLLDNLNKNDIKIIKNMNIKRKIKRPNIKVLDGDPNFKGYKSNEFF